MKDDKRKLIPPNSNGHDGDHRELSRLLAAAIISRDFRQRLLADPKQALATGYNGLHFALTDEDRSIILSIHTTSLVDFAAQLANRQNGNGAANGKDHTAPISEKALFVDRFEML